MVQGVMIEVMFVVLVLWLYKSTQWLDLRNQEIMKYCEEIFKSRAGGAKRKELIQWDFVFGLNIIKFSPSF